MASGRITINDVAVEAGVSRQTVTRAMNDMAEISPATRARVLHAVEKLGYRPSRFASNLARQKHHTLGLVIRSLRNPYYADLAAEILDVMSAVGWQTSVETNGSATDVDVVTELSAHVDVIAGYFEDTDEAVLHAARGVPIIMFERPARMPGMHSIQLDFETGMRNLLDVLRARGARGFGMIDSRSAAPGSTYVPSVRRKAFERFVDDDSRQRIVTAPETITAAAHAFIELKTRFPELDTLIGFNDLMAMGAMQAAHSMQVEVPGAVRIVGIDGLSLGEAMFPALTTLSLDLRSLAVNVAEMSAELAGKAPGAASVTRVVEPYALWRASA